MDLSTTNKFSLKVDFGDISKTDVKWESLERALAISKVNLNHEIFQELKQKKRTSLCIVLESLACKKDGTLDETSDMKGTMNSNILCMPCNEQNTLWAVIGMQKLFCLCNQNVKKIFMCTHSD